jgi:hypothetical protein
MHGATITDKGDYLRADLIHRQSGPELEQFLRQLQDAAVEHASSRVLINAHVARASYKIDKYHGSHFIDVLAARPALKVALVAVHREVQLVHQYIESLARLKKARLRSFPDEAAALAWLLTPAPALKRASTRARPKR